MTATSSKLLPYPDRLSFFVNNILFPIMMILPQPVVAKIPGLLTNEDIRHNMVFQFLKGRALDIGCGENRLMKMYRKRGGDGTGVDIYPWSGVDMVVKDSSRLPFPDASFDTVTFVACLNHIPNREAVLREALRILCSDGHIIFTNLSPLVSRIWHAWAFWDKDQHKRGMKDGEVWGFSEKELIGILQRNGFEISFKRRFAWRLNQLYICKRL